jgi:hypothetical protein
MNSPILHATQPVTLKQVAQAWDVSFLSFCTARHRTRFGKGCLQPTGTETCTDPLSLFARINLDHFAYVVFTRTVAVTMRSQK